MIFVVACWLLLCSRCSIILIESSLNSSSSFLLYKLMRKIFSAVEMWLSFCCCKMKLNRNKFFWLSCRTEIKVEGMRWKFSHFATHTTWIFAYVRSDIFSSGSDRLESCENKLTVRSLEKLFLAFDIRLCCLLSWVISDFLRSISLEIHPWPLCVFN